jgi:L-alanine-DL-glutamate epimerase-like enolase superfamily enzyme
LPHGAHKYGLKNDIVIGKDGLAHCPTAPGIGAEIDLELIARTTTGRLS